MGALGAAGGAVGCCGQDHGIRLQPLREGDAQPKGDSSRTLLFFPFSYFYPCQIENKASTKGTQPTSLQSDALGRNLCRIYTP